MRFDELKKEYYSINEGCCKCGRIYDFRKDKLNPVFCKMWICDRCRKMLKYWLYLETVKNALIFDLDKHFIITCRGKQFRREYGYIDSFYYMSDMWRNFKKCIEYKYGGLNYILFPRSQKDGYCHYHILIDKRVSWRFLNKKRKNYGLGYVSIQRNRSVADYLHKDFFKDHEYIIPKGIRHYSSSRSIVLNTNAKQNDDYKIFFRTHDLEFIYNEIKDRFGYPLPFEEYVKEFYKKL